MQPRITEIKARFAFQNDQSDCGVACLLSVIQYYQGFSGLESLRKLSGTNTSGTTLLGLYYAALQLGFDAEGCEADIAALFMHDSPCILHVTLEGNLQHYVVCFGSTEKNGELKFIIGDPAKGIIYLSSDELGQIWKSKACLTLKPNSRFQKASEIGKAKRKWIMNLIKEDISLLTIAAVIGTSVAALGLVMAIFSQRLIDDILPKRNYSKLTIGIVLVFILLIVKEALSALRQYFLLRQSKDFNSRVIDFFYQHLLQLPKSFFDTRKIGELTARLNDTSRIQRVISQLAGNLVIDALVVIVSTTFVFAYSFQIGMVCLLATPVFYLLVYLHNKKLLEGQRAIMSSYAMAEANYISTLQGIEPIKNYNKQNLFSTVNKAIYQNYQNKILSLGKIQIKLTFLANGFGIIFLVITLLISCYQVLNNHLKTGELIAILGMCGSLLPGVANLAMISIPLNEAKIAFDRMFEFTGIKAEEDEKNSKLFRFNSIKVYQLGFRFAGRSQLLKSISFEVQRGEIVALMGENGSGKSTLSQIIQKFYQPETGQIIVNGMYLWKDIPISSWRNIVGIVPQQIHIFNGTILDNIAFEDAASKPQEVLDFLERSGFLPFIDRLPQSFMTLVGEEGINLSGGQKQIIALARALYHKPQLLLLDEATAAMDRKSEQFALGLLQRLKKNLAIIFITHRLQVLKSFCDRVYIIEGGTITSEGSHEDLLKEENLYSQYWADIVQ
jgi:ATP-binding cassette, subfamily C, bacteriocin exporter